VLLSIISANWINEFLGKISGKEVIGFCTDSDGPNNFLETGFVQVEGESGIYEDYCIGDTAYDYYCIQDIPVGTGEAILNPTNPGSVPTIPDITTPTTTGDSSTGDDTTPPPPTPPPSVPSPPSSVYSSTTSVNCQEIYSLPCNNGRCGGCTEGQIQICEGLDTGICDPGTRTCINDDWGSCEGIIEPGIETSFLKCSDGLDNDCDGNVDCGDIDCNTWCSECDPGQTRPCGENIGECNSGEETCGLDGTWTGICVGEKGPEPEICDNLDNDCDGLFDENQYENPLYQVCGSNIGQCSEGIIQCFAGTWTECIGQTTPEPEICDGLDNDCDEYTDEDCNCINGDVQACGEELGECEQGLQTCANEEWGNCVGEITSAPEICDGLDNNCNGFIDENNVCENLVGQLTQQSTLETTEVLTCTDTDPTNNLFAKGYAQGLNLYNIEYNYPDICINEKQMFQYSCSQKSGTQILEKILNTCPENYKCQEDACIFKGLTTESMLTTPCIESGKNLPLKILGSCYNEESGKLEITSFKGSETQQLDFLDFIIKTTEETQIYTCGKTCEECDILEKGIQTYFIELKKENLKLKTMILKSNNCITEPIKIAKC